MAQGALRLVDTRIPLNPVVFSNDTSDLFAGLSDLWFLLFWSLLSHLDVLVKFALVFRCFCSCCAGCHFFVFHCRLFRPCCRRRLCCCCFRLRTCAFLILRRKVSLSRVDRIVSVCQAFGCVTFEHTSARLLVVFPVFTRLVFLFIRFHVLCFVLLLLTCRKSILHPILFSPAPVRVLQFCRHW